MGIEAQGYSVRAAAREDFDAIVGLVRAADLVDWGSPDFTAEWLQHEWSFPQLDLASDTRLVELDGQVCAYAWQLARAEHKELDGWGVVHPQHRGRGLGSTLVGWVEARAAEHATIAP